MHGTDISAPESSALGDATPTPVSLGATGPGVPGLLLLGSPGSQVTNVERLLHETLASVDRNILRLIRVSLKKEERVCLCTSSFLQVPLLSHVFLSVEPILR
jgi:hypothetical protein